MQPRCRGALLLRRLLITFKAREAGARVEAPLGFHCGLGGRARHRSEAETGFDLCLKFELRLCGLALGGFLILICTPFQPPNNIQPVIRLRAAYSEARALKPSVE